MKKTCVICGEDFAGRRERRVCGPDCLAEIRRRNQSGRRTIPPPVETSDGCLLWQGAPTVYGYGRTSIDGRDLQAHRAAWIKAHGPISDELDVDHICRNRLCVNVAHLRTATRSENLQNTVSRAGSSSRYIGVYWSSNDRRWIAWGKLNSRRHVVGYFTDEDEAGAAAAEWRREHLPFSQEARHA